MELVTYEGYGANNQCGCSKYGIKLMQLRKCCQFEQLFDALRARNHAVRTYKKKSGQAKLSIPSWANKVSLSELSENKHFYLQGMILSGFGSLAEG